MSKRTGTTHEPLLNGAVAEQLRQLGLEAQAEQTVSDSDGRLHRVDVLIELDDDSIAIEAEFAPARTVRGDARKRLPSRPLHWRGLPVTSVLTLVYPEALQRIPESDSPDHLRRSEAIIFAQGIRNEHADARQVDLFPDRDGDIAWRPSQRGSLRELAELLHDFWIRTSRAVSIDETVAKASRAISTASEILARAPAMQVDKEADRAATCALIWLNALLFQELLARDLDPKFLPPPSTGVPIPRPGTEDRAGDVLRQWTAILQINWWPIFHVARETLSTIPSPIDAHALNVLRPCARSMAEDQVIRRHDVAGRIFHRLLDTRKFLATNYTTIPAAVLLAALALDDEAPSWQRFDWSDPRRVGKLRVVDPACGSGTLLMAALQEILKRSRRAPASPADQRETIRGILENGLLGFDVVAGAIHLTAATLSMAETRQILKDLPLFLMPHDLHRGVARLGSLDFLRKAPNHNRVRARQMFPSARDDATRTTGEGIQEHDASFPTECDLIISNPPYTRAGGPGKADHTDWNPLFGSVLSKADAGKMSKALGKTLSGTPASLYAGLGSAFVTLAHEHLGVGGRLAFVLPATALTGSRWQPVRQLLLDHYHVEWVVVSHDPRTRSARAGLPGRHYVAFSESTRLAETLIVATRHRTDVPDPGWTHFVNLRRNPDEPIEALGIARALLSRRDHAGTGGDRPEIRAIDTTYDAWGEVIAVPQTNLTSAAWAQTTFMQSTLTLAALDLRQTGSIGDAEIPIAALQDICALGPYEMQIKNPRQGLFHIVETTDPTAMGEPALWHHSGKRIVTLEVEANARLRFRADRSSADQQEMLTAAARLQIARELRHAPQRLAAVCTPGPMLGVRSWITTKPLERADGFEETLCLWLNSTLGFLLRLIHANRPYLGRTALPHELAYTLPVLDVRQLDTEQLQAGKRLFSDLAQRRLEGFAQLAEDVSRRELDRRFIGEVLRLDECDVVEQIARALADEPLLTSRH